MARLDCLLSFSRIAIDYHYCRPEVNESTTIEITEGRHPVIERQLPVDEAYVTNNVKLDDQEQQIIILTGPNMSGKSAFLRQTALITLMAQVGSFVPAESARIGWVDKIFTQGWSLRQHLPWRIHFYGGDAGSCKHSEQPF